LNGALARALLAAGLATAGTAARAQDVPQVISPLRVETDHNDVNMATGKTVPEGPVLSVPAAPNLSFERVQNAAPYVTGRVSGGPGDMPVGNYSVHAGGAASESFLCSDTIDCESATGTGSTFRPVGLNSFRYQQAGSGAVYTFNLKHANSGGSPRTIQYYASRVAWPNGEAIDYSYDTIVYGGLTYYRPATLTSNMGYRIALTYRGSDFANDPAGWATTASATLYATAAPSTPLRRLTYGGGTVVDSGDTVADASDDRSYGCAGCGGTLGVDVEAPSATLQLPGEASPTLQAVAHPSAQVVATVTRDGVQWTYAYQNLRQEPGNPTWLFDGVTATGPNGFSQTYHTMQGGPVKSRFNAVTGITDSLGRTTGAEIDPVTMRVTRITSPEGNAASVQYDAAGNIVSSIRHARPGTGLADIAQSAGYTLPSLANTCNVACWRPNWTRDALGRQTDYLYSAGLLIQQDDPADANGVRRRTIVEYATSPAGISRRSAVRICGIGTTCGTAQEHRTEYQYLGDTLLVTRERLVDPATGAMLDTVNLYDGQGRLVSSDGPLPGSDDAVYNRYDAYGRKTWEIGAADANGVRPATRTYYRDADDKVLYVERGTVPAWDSAALTVLSRTDFTYDARRNPVRETMSSGGTTYALVQRSFDDRGQLLCEAVRMNPALFATPPADPCVPGAEGTGVNAFGPDRITRNVYDLAGQRLQLREGVGSAVEAAEATWAYNLNGQVATVIDGNGNRAELRYDGHMRQDRWTFPSTTRAASFNDATQASALASAGSVNAADYEEYGYDAAGNRTSFRKRDGSTLTYQYDQLNRMIVKIVPERAGLSATHTRDVYYGYDLRNLQLYARFDSATGEGVTNGYDAFGRLISSTINLDGISRPLTYQWDAGGRRTRVTHPDGYYSTYAYDPAGRLTVVYHANGAPLQFFAYDAAGRLAATARAVGNGTVYGYDALSRPSALSHDLPGTNADLTLGFAYNPAGGIRTRTQNNDAYAWTGAYNVNRAYTTNGLNQYTQAGPAAFAYDPNGNLTSDGSTAFTYDVENRLVAASGARTAALRYDPLGRLYEVTGSAGTTRFLYDGDALVAEYDAAGARQHLYVHADGADTPLIWFTPADIRFLHTDHQGSIVAVSSIVTGTVVAVNSYDEYGIPAAGNVGRFQYTGQAWLPELGMYHYKARIYSPTLGRFLQTDLVGYEGGINLYGYVGNDPVNRNDPTGLIDIYIGGASDASSTHIVQNYARGRGVYFSHSSAGGAIRLMRDAAARGEPINVIGHSLGGAAAISLVGLAGVRVDLLITIDPVGGVYNPSRAGWNAREWVNVTANPEQADRSDYIAGVGRALLANPETGGADENVATRRHHGQFSEMMSDISADGRIRESNRHHRIEQRRQQRLRDQALRRFEGLTRALGSRIGCRRNETVC
jgi:RHS repeat-associated protein